MLVDNSTPGKQIKRNYENINSPENDGGSYVAKKVDSRRTPVKADEGSDTDWYEEIKEDGAPKWFLTYILRTAKQTKAIEYELSELRATTNKEVESLKEQIEKQNVEIDSLRDKVENLEVYTRKANLIIEGIAESRDENIYQKVSDFLAETLGIVEDIPVSIAHRLGIRTGRKPRAIIIRFVSLRDKDLVWSCRTRLAGSGIVMKQHYTPEIQKSRNEMYPYLKAAKQCRSIAKCNLVRGKLSIDGTLYGPENVHDLPHGIGEQSHTSHDGGITRFFTKRAPLSNFHDAPFRLDGVAYAHVEQYYQVQRAEFYNADSIAYKMMRSQDPAYIKSLSYKVKSPERETEWFDKRARQVMMRGVQAKFAQNPELAEYLIHRTQPIIAECNPRDSHFSTGLGMKHPNSLEKDKWPGKNILGDILCSVRSLLTSTKEK